MIMINGNCDYQWLNKILIYDLEEDSWSDGGVIPAMNESGLYNGQECKGVIKFIFVGRYVETNKNALWLDFDTINKTWSTSNLPNENLYNVSLFIIMEIFMFLIWIGLS